MPQTTQPRVELVNNGRGTRRPVEGYGELNTPAYQRRARAVGDDVRADADESYLDIPAFLRRQAD
jgi:hypothetical protein